MNNSHKMNLNLTTFNLISSGIKKIELRLFDEKRRKIKIGDTIFFNNNDSKDILERQVKDLIVKPTFEEIFFNDFKKVDAGYFNEEDDVNLNMNKYYLKKDLEKYGVVGIVLS